MILLITVVNCSESDSDPVVHQKPKNIEERKVPSRTLGSKETAQRFSDLLREANVTPENPNVSNGWATFKYFCQTPVDGYFEGFIFEAGFEADFPPPDHTRVLDYSTYTVTFTRYWSIEVEGANTPHLARCSFELEGLERLKIHESVNIEGFNDDKQKSDHVSGLNKFIEKVESNVDLWDAIRATRVRSMKFYAGPQ